MLKTFQGRLVAIFVAAGALLAVVGLEVDRSARAFRDDAARVAEAITRSDLIGRTLSAIRATESAQRGYLITGLDRDLQDYLSALSQVDAETARLSALFEATGRDVEPVRELETLIAARLAILDATLTIRRAEGIAAAAARVASGEGHRAMDAVETAVASLRGTEGRRSDKGANTTASSAARMRTLVPLALLLCGVVLAIALSLTVSEQRRRRAAESDLSESAQQLVESLGESHRMAHDLRELTDFAELLQSCRTIDEAREGACAAFKSLLPEAGGRLALINPSQNAAAIAAHWGEHHLNAESVFAPDDCWALRRGQPHPAAGRSTGFVCRHVHAPEPGRSGAQSFCIPLTAQGEVLGVLTLDSAAQLDDRHRNIAVAAADHLALALANLRLQEDLRRQSIRDPLTGLFNRRYLEESAERELMRANRRGLPVAVLMLDLDHFKRLNDTFGHEAGDLVLARFGALLKGKARGEDIACRYGGEEFTALLLETDLASALARAEEILAETTQIELVHRSQRIGPLSVSIGVAMFPQHGSTLKQLQAAADGALYEAKNSGRNRVEVAAGVAGERPSVSTG